MTNLRKRLIFSTAVLLLAIPSPAYALNDGDPWSACADRPIIEYKEISDGHKSVGHMILWDCTNDGFYVSVESDQISNLSIYFERSKPYAEFTRYNTSHELRSPILKKHYTCYRAVADIDFNENDIQYCNM